MFAKAFLMRSGFTVFRYRDYRLFWLAAAFANLGMWSLTYGRLWLMHDLTHSPLMVGLVTTASLGPLLIFSMWGGVVADRVNRLKLIRLTRAILSVLALLTGVLIATEIIRPWHLITISVATGVLLSFDGPARAAMLPALVPQAHLASAVSLYSIVSGAAAIVGPAFFAALIELWGIAGVFFLNGVAYALNVVTLLFMKPSDHQPTSRPQTLVRALIEGVQYIRTHRVLGSVILLTAVASMFGTTYQTLLPIFADQILTGGVKTYSHLLLVAGIAGLFASVIMTILGPRVSPALFMLWAGLGWGLGLLMLAFVSWWAGVVALVGVISASRVVFATMNTTLSQSLSADALRGRVMSVQGFAWGMTALGGLLMGAVAEGLGVSAALAIGGITTTSATGAVAVWTLRRRAAGKRGMLSSSPQLEPLLMASAKPGSSVAETR